MFEGSAFGDVYDFLDCVHTLLYPSSTSPCRTYFHLSHTEELELIEPHRLVNRITFRSYILIGHQIWRLRCGRRSSLRIDICFAILLCLLQFWRDGDRSIRQHCQRRLYEELVFMSHKCAKIHQVHDNDGTGSS